MPIYEYYCRDNHRIYQFYAKTLAQGRKVPPCPDGSGLRMEKLVSAFAVTGGAKKDLPPSPPEGSYGAAAGLEARPDDSRLDSAMAAMEGEMAGVDENDPRAMGRMMRKMAELSGEKIDGEMEEVMRKLEEGADPESLEDRLGGDGEGGGDAPSEEDPEDPPLGGEKKEPRQRFKSRKGPPTRDPKLYDYPESRG